MKSPVSQAVTILKGVPLDLNPSTVSGASAQLSGQRQFTSPLPDNNLVSGALNLLRTPINPQSNIAAQQLSPTPIHNQFGFRSDMDSLIRKSFPDDPSTAAAIGMQESSLNPEARYTDRKNGIDAIGLMQINLPAHQDIVPGKTYEEKVRNLMNPETNLQLANQIHSKQGWQPWQAYTSGQYQRFLDK